MDTEKILPFIDFDIDDITLPDFTDDALHIIQSYIEVTRHAQEIHQLFELFRYNLKRLLSVYELNNGDRVKRHGPLFEGFSDRIELNALVINYISSGKTLIDSMQSCIKCTYSEDNTKYNEFSKFLSSVYDDCFSYRLLTRLRDFAQHGHLPVSVSDNIMCFDTAQIASTPHFNHNKTILEEMNRFNEELLVAQKTQPRYVFTLAIAQYTVSMHEVYQTFWLTLKDSFFAKENDFRILIKQVPESIVHKNDKMNGFLFYLANDSLHAFNTSEDSLSMFSHHLEEAKQIYELEVNELNEFKKTIKFEIIEKP